MSALPAHARCIALCALLLAGVYSAPAVAQQTVPPKLALVVMLRMLAYDRNLAVRGEGEFVVVVAHEAGQEGLRDQVLDAGKGMSFQKRALRFVPVDLKGATRETLTKGGASALLVLPGISQPGLDAVLQSAQDAKIYTLSLDPVLVEKSQVAVGVASHDGKPQLLLNLAAAKRMNASFDPAVLKLAKIFQ